jgi:hypothetical protein
VGQINGIDGSGNQDPLQGWQRARALILLFGASSAADPYPHFCAQSAEWPKAERTNTLCLKLY